MRRLYAVRDTNLEVALRHKLIRLPEIGPSKPRLRKRRISSLRDIGFVIAHAALHDNATRPRRGDRIVVADLENQPFLKNLLDTSRKPWLWVRWPKRPAIREPRQARAVVENLVPSSPHGLVDVACQHQSDDNKTLAAA